MVGNVVDPRTGLMLEVGGTNCIKPIDAADMLLGFKLTGASVVANVVLGGVNGS